MLELPDNFFDEEIRDDFLVTSSRKRIWSVQLDLLNEFLVVCRKNNISCFVVWGTLLGAIRHKGFIPWDDDIDVGLLRPDYDRLKQLAPQCFKEPYFFQNAYTDKKFFISYSRLRRSDTTGIVKGNASPDYNNGIFIDIYPLDGIPKSMFRNGIKRFFSDLYAGLARAKILENYKRLPVKTRILKIFSTIFTYEKLCNHHERWCSKYNEFCTQIGLYYHRRLIKHYHFAKKDVAKIYYMPFENIMVPVPNNYEDILKTVYGEYLEFPPVYKRGKWHEGEILYDPDMPYRKYFQYHASIEFRIDN